MSYDEVVLDFDPYKEMVNAANSSDAKILSGDESDETLELELTREDGDIDDISVSFDVGTDGPFLEVYNDTADITEFLYGDDAFDELIDMLNDWKIVA